MHPSIIKTGCQLKSKTGNCLQLGCPLCPKFTTTHARTMCRHLESHIKNAVYFQGKLMTRGNKCGLLLINSVAFTVHLKVNSFTYSYQL